jgi:hypothetical protein
MKTRGGKTQPGALKYPTSTSREDVQEEKQEQEHEPEDPGEKQIESVINEPDILSLPRPKKRHYSNVLKGKIFISFPNHLLHSITAVIVKIFSVKLQLVLVPPN